MNRVNFLKKFIVLTLIGSILGCSNPSDQDSTIPTTPAHQKLIQLYKDDYNLDVVTRAFENTLWIYLPLDHSFLSITSSKAGPLRSSDSKEKWDIKFLDTEFTDGSFHLRYDIALKKSYTTSNGITTKFSEEYQAKQTYLLGAITRAYSEIEKKPNSNRYVEKIAGDIDLPDQRENLSHKELVHSYVKTSEVPDFIVIGYCRYRERH